jgi:hypothetical protein
VRTKKRIVSDFKWSTLNERARRARGARQPVWIVTDVALKTGSDHDGIQTWKSIFDSCFVNLVRMIEARHTRPQPICGRICDDLMPMKCSCRKYSASCIGRYDPQLACIMDLPTERSERWRP